MRGKRAVIGGVLLLALASLTAGAFATKLARISVRVPRHPSVVGKLEISFQPHGRLPRGGYYYAVIVLTNYPRHSAAEQPSCAVSSDMEETEYGYPGRSRVMRLTLIPAKSADKRWCAGTYTGAVYAVPHKPPCNHSHPCYGKKANGACWELEGKYVCGIVAEGPAEREAREKAEREAKEKAEREAREKTEREAKEKTNLEEREKAEREAKEKAERESNVAPPYSYPGGLPKPIDRSTRIVGYFQVTF
ncbi:MAG: hypothetical protein ACRDLF_13875 [Solirubrobacteraceae bacterium]